MFEMPNEEKHYNFDNKRQRKHQDSALAIKDTHALHSVQAIKETTTLTIKKSEKTTRSEKLRLRLPNLQRLQERRNDKDIRNKD